MDQFSTSRHFDRQALTFLRLAPGRDGDNEMDEWIIMVDIAEDDNDYQTRDLYLGKRLSSLVGSSAKRRSRVLTLSR